MMKKFKKPLSMILAAVMALSACVVGFTAFAAGERDLTTVQGIQDAILSDFTSSSVKLKDDVKTAYTALDETQKNSISAGATTRLFRMSYNSASGSGAAKVDASVAALGGYTAKQQEAFNIGKMFSGYAAYETPEGTYNAVGINYLPFDKDYTTSGKTFTVADQINIAKYVMNKYKELMNDPYTMELADSVYALSSYQYFYGSAYGAITSKIFPMVAKYFPITSPDASAAEIASMIVSNLGLVEGGSYDVYGTIKAYSDPALTAALNAYNESDKGPEARNTFKTLVKDLYEAMKVSYTLPYLFTSNFYASNAKILNVNGELKSVADVWSPIGEAYAAILDAEATAPVIEKMVALNLADYTTSAQVETAFVNTGYKALTSGQKTAVQNDEKSGPIYTKLIKAAYDSDTKAFRDAVTAYKIPTEITDSNKKDVLDKIAEFTKMYDGLKSDLKTVSSSKTVLQNFIKNTYPSVQTKYEKILDLNYAISSSDLVAAVKAFDLNAAPGSGLNEKIASIKALYTALDSKTI